MGRITIATDVNVFQEDVVSAAAFVIAGVGILSNLDRLVQLDQNCSPKLKAWFHEKLGEKSILNRELWPVGAGKGIRFSRNLLRLTAILFILVGVAGLGLILYSSGHLGFLLTQKASQ